jgi:hypothetical protein
MTIVIHGMAYARAVCSHDMFLLQGCINEECTRAELFGNMHGEPGRLKQIRHDRRPSLLSMKHVPISRPQQLGNLALPASVARPRLLRCARNSKVFVDPRAVSANTRDSQ